MAYVSTHILFNSLDDREERKFRDWALLHYKPGDEIKDSWHPVVQDECARINRAHASDIACQGPFGADMQLVGAYYRDHCRRGQSDLRGTCWDEGDS